MPTSSPQSSPSRRSRFAVLAAATLVALLFAEVVLRIYFPQVGKLRQLIVSTDDERGFEPKRNVALSFAGVFSPLSRAVEWQTNSQGLRDDRDVIEDSERFRVAVFGDSETFGWALPLEETFQRQMEAIDPRVEVLNFGVPGYNVTNVRHHLELNVPRFDPDLVIYLVNKNDFNEPVTFSLLSYSHVLLHLRFLWHFTVAKPIRRMHRSDADRLTRFGDEINRMTALLAERDVPFIVGFLKWRNHTAVRDFEVGARPVRARRFRRDLVNVKDVVRGEPREDGHYARSAHGKMAALFCGIISEAPNSACVPADWQPDAFAARGVARSGAFAE
jgi:hypothetical protein